MPEWFWSNLLAIWRVFPAFGQWLQADYFRALLLVVCVVLAYVHLDLRDRAGRAVREAGQIVADYSNQVRSLKRQVATYEGCRTGSPQGDPPIRVTFADDVVAYVNFFQQMKPLDPQACTTGTVYFPGDGIVWEPVESREPLAPEDCKMFRLPGGPAEELAARSLAAVINELELLTFRAARKDRQGISERVRHVVAPQFAEHGVKLDALHLLEFCVATDVGGKLPTDPDIPRFGLDW